MAQLFMVISSHWSQSIGNNLYITETLGVVVVFLIIHIIHQHHPAAEPTTRGESKRRQSRTKYSEGDLITF